MMMKEVDNVSLVVSYFGVIVLTKNVYLIRRMMWMRVLDCKREERLRHRRRLR